jgi:hypothetical protein
MFAKRLFASKWLMLVAACAVVGLGAGTSLADGHHHGFAVGFGYRPGYSYYPSYVQTYPSPYYGYAPYYAPPVIVVQQPVFGPRFFVGNRGFEHRGFRR